MDFSSLNSEQFELLVGRLIKAEGLLLEDLTRRGRDMGLDFVAEGREKIAIEVRHRTTNQFFRSDVHETIRNLMNAAALLNITKYLLVISGEIDLKTTSRLGTEYPHVGIWDSAVLNKLLEKHPPIANEFAVLIAQTQSIRNQISPPALNADSQALIERLHALPPGRVDWRQYEDLCIEILNHLFVPPLGVPVVQSRSEDGLDRRDAVYQINARDGFWETVRTEFRSRFVVAEFKNCTDEMGQQEIESVQQYLYEKAMRRFGLLCGRQQLSANGLIARRRSWMEFDKMVVALSDGDLEEMIRIKARGDDPTAVLDTQINQFFRDLAP